MPRNFLNAPPARSKGKREKGSRDYFPDATKAYVIDPSPCVVPVADRHAQPPRKEVPGAPANHALRAGLRSGRIPRWLVRRQCRGVVVFAVPVGDPFPNIAGHVIQAPSVWRV